jgi:hypothetical protein
VSNIGVRKLPGFLLAGALLLAMAWLSFYLPKSSQQPVTLAASGDLLYDHFADLINADLLQHEYRLLVPDDYIADTGMKFLNPPAQFTSSRILEWEPEFANDPRYWQLRWLMRSDASQQEYASPALYSSPILVSVWQRGIRDEASCYLLFLQSSAEERKEYVLFGMEAWPDNSYWHYRAAEMALEQADWEAFTEYMRNGNAAKRNELPHPWPICLLINDVNLPMDDDSLTIQGVIAQLARSQRDGALRQPPEPLDLKTAEELSAEFVEEFVNMQVRIASSNGNGLNQLWRPAVALNELLSAAGLGENWTKQQRSLLASRRTWGRELTGLAKPTLFGATTYSQFELPALAQLDEQQFDLTVAIPIEDRVQASWISTLQSFQLDQRRAKELAASFEALQEGLEAPLNQDS